MKQTATKLNEASEITIPLRNLISMIAFTAVSVWVYFGLTERISFLEHNLELTMQEVEENDNWIDDFEPPKSVQDTVARVHDLEIELAKLKLSMELNK
jgi:agmatine/peptidylarginine deiminase|tara:strand:+ start:174 stop:467 length:294 start_codon:yes stop_codon:yes gene_type:complete